MLKGIEYTALISAIVFAICLFALMFFYASPSTSTETPQQQSAEKQEPIQHKGEAEKPFWEKATTDPIAAFTLFLVVFTAVLSAVGVIQLRLLARAETVAEKSANAAKKSADVAKDTLVSANRPWISGEFKIVSDLTFEAPGARLTIEYTLRNSGNTPAIGVTPYPKFLTLKLGKISGDPPNIIMQAHRTDAAAELVSLCDAARQFGDAPFAQPVQWDVIFPNAPLTDRVTVTLDASDIEEAASQSAYKVISPIFLICFNYKSPLENPSHQTGYIFYVVTNDPAHQHGIDPTKGNIGAHKLSLMRYPFRSGIAN